MASWPTTPTFTLWRPRRPLRALTPASKRYFLKMYFPSLFIQVDKKKCVFTSVSFDNHLGTYLGDCFSNHWYKNSDFFWQIFYVFVCCLFIFFLFALKFHFVLLQDGGRWHWQLELANFAKPVPDAAQRHQHQRCLSGAFKKKMKEKKMQLQFYCFVFFLG